MAALDLASLRSLSSILQYKSTAGDVILMVSFFFVLNVSLPVSLRCLLSWGSRWSLAGSKTLRQAG